MLANCEGFCGSRVPSALPEGGRRPAGHAGPFPGKGVDLAGTTVLWLRALADQLEADQQGGSHDGPDGPPAPDR